ncbi:four helix bundle protein [Granulicella mallensis]|uniref:Four helix bundle protein n=1 Tax=Granulicella mallensis TaxID=940614 RepID=A0A7W8EC37_9BACT|nr:four helix bundle protein [Granulicella mallensis]MBB5066497.1 four helix bundle protein [Granulicella mallensis]
MQDFRNIEFWRKAHVLVLAIYRETQSLPKEEVFGLTIQLRRSATAIATRIAEGCGRENNLEFAADLRKAQASCNELEYLIELAKDLTYWKPESSAKLTAEAIEVRKMIHGYLRKF